MTVAELQPRILFEDEKILAIDKPSGLASQPLPENPEEFTASAFAFKHAPQIRSVGRDPLEGGLLHRLDLATSGVLLFAKDQETYSAIKTAWKTPAVEKHYRAWVSGAPAVTGPFPRLIDFPIGHSAKSRGRMIAVTRPELTRQLRGRPLAARTWIERVMGIRDGDSADLHLRIETGVMHQIRCHLGAIEHPILGDEKYKGPSSNRLWLHAWRVILRGVPGIDPQVIEAPMPEGWSK